MKIIGLLIVKNESWILQTTLPQQLRFVDELLVLEGNSTDDTVRILRNFGKNTNKVHVRIQKGNNDNYAAWRQELLTWARERGATHIVSIDGDEALSSDTLTHWHSTLSRMKPGEKLFFEWITLWKSPFTYLTSGSIFAHLNKDFVFCDDKTSPYAKIALHEGRTPGITTKQNSIYIPQERGVVLHFQFVPWERVQMKQAFQRCRELTLHTDTAKGINYKYEQTLDNPNAKTESVPAKWIDKFKLSEKLSKSPRDWFYKSILQYFKDNGIAFYEPVQIWQIPELRAEFVKKMGRNPKAQTYNTITRVTRIVVGKILSIFPAQARTIIFVTIKKINKQIGF